MRKNTPKKLTFSFPGSYALVIVLLLAVVVFGSLLYIRGDPVCGEITPTSVSDTPAGNKDQRKGVAWGEAVQGMQCRMRPAETNQATTILLYDVRNIGNVTFYGYWTPVVNFAVRIDNNWYHWLGDVDAKGNRFSPGCIYSDSIDLSHPKWGIDVSLGSHCVQIAILVSKRWPFWPRCIWVPSNVLSVEFPRLIR